MSREILDKRHSVSSFSKTNSSNVTPSFKFTEYDSVDFNLTPRDPSILNYMRASQAANFENQITSNRTKQTFRDKTESLQAPRKGSNTLDSPTVSFLKFFGSNT